MIAYKCDVCGCYCDDVYRMETDTFDVFPGDKMNYGIKDDRRTEIRDMCKCCYETIKGCIHGMYLKRLRNGEKNEQNI